ncbi:NUDIX domain-containing protein [Nocardioides sp. cx-173]|uniref:NUDIX domain-containing protein n=1 Tax=Nocardioides sp. cx-173 TaxID=2898796 RepID=UPI001E631F63|nr:NUDIX hydrolase [Nocardioides sp. cx-173]MCD4527261.1 NUDIX hydrolase [Nocardioides sp. cx-173]UGB40362.1 NUDIX hydrolase [Nocardioides sp. cx-173]
MTWATCSHGHNHWGRRGAAGLLIAEGGRVLLQLRAHWAHQGGTWSIPGGARERGETWEQAAIREAGEELGLAAHEVAVRGSSTASCGGWTYETVLAVPTGPLRLADLAESDGHAWVPAAEVTDLPLHASFREAWSAPDSSLAKFVAAS